MLIRCLPAAAVPVALLLTSLAPPATAQDGSLEFLEAYSLGTDREAALELLPPGSVAWYRYRCLTLQHAGRLHEAREVLDQWIEQHGRGAEVDEAENRLALLGHDTDPSGTYAFLRERLGLTFDHHRDVPGAQPDLPAALSPDDVSWEAFRDQALRRHGGTLAGWHDHALGALVTPGLEGSRLHEVLARLRDPTLPGLVPLVLRDLDGKTSQGFGSLAIHGLLTLPQLEACAEARPALLEDDDFVRAWLLRLAPPVSVDWRVDAAAREAYLDRLLGFVRRLPSRHDSLKAHVLYQRLVHDRQRGLHDRDLFLEYLELPRRGDLRSEEFTKRHQGRFVEADATFGTGFAAIGSDRELVTAYLQEFFRGDETWSGFSRFLDDDALRRLFAETKLLEGLGDAERWASLLDDAEALAALRDRVEIAFAPTRRAFYGPDEVVTLDVDLKHVDTLLLRVFEIDTFAAYTEREAGIDIDIDLSGLVANREQVLTFDAPPIRRVRRSLAVPGLDAPGVYVVELVGHGVASRALVRKGRLQLVQRVGAAGHVLRVLDDGGAHLPDADVWFGGRVYGPDDRGEVLLPFSAASPGSKPVVLRHGDRATLTTIEHQAETYALEAPVFVERESLLPGATARLVVRPALHVSGNRASLALLEQPVLTVTAWDHDGVETVQSVEGLELQDGAELVHEITVPERLARLSVSLGGRVTTLTKGDVQELASRAAVFELSAIANTAGIAAPLLGRTPDGYVLDVLGRNGEPLADQVVGVELRHEDFRDTILKVLRTDPSGRITLGPLPGIEQVEVEGAVLATWVLRGDRVDRPERLFAEVGQVLSVPWVGGALDRGACSLVELRGDLPVRDRFDHATLRDGMLEIAGLPAGRYRLTLPLERHEIAIEIGEGTATGGWLVGGARMLPLPRSQTLHVREVRSDDDALTVRLAGVSAQTRVHVSASRWLPAHDPFDALSTRPSETPLAEAVERPSSRYAPARTLSDEERYVLERRLATVFPGNMLDRPTLLLNPWELDEVRTELSSGSEGVIGVGGGGGGFGGRGKRGARSSDMMVVPSGGPWADLSFLPAPAVQLTGLRPDADGTLRIPRGLLGPGHLVQVLAVDGEQTVLRSVVLPEPPLAPRDLRLAQPFAADRSVTEQRRIDALAAGEQAVFEDVATSEAELVDSLASAFALLSALGDADALAPFSPLVRWPELSREEQLAFYDEHACHELHLFLHRRDPAFFDEVVRPYLGNKRRLTFIDHWLLDHDLTPWLAPWEYGRLHVVERILLASRLPDQADAVERELAEWLETRPPDAAALRAQFETALRGAGFAGGSEVARELGVAREEALLAGRGRVMSIQAPAPGEAVDEEQLEALAQIGYLGDDDVDDFSVSGDFNLLPLDVSLRGQVMRLFTGPGRTRRFVEHDHWHRRVADTGPELVPVNAFWLDLARARGARPFVSPHVAEVGGQLNASLMALALLDLPFTAGEHETAIEGRRMTVTAGGPLLLVRKEITDAPRADDGPPVLVSQGLFRLDDRYRQEGSRRLDRFVTDEFVAGVVYGCQVVVTNPTSAPLDLELLVQIPEGALPVAGARETRGTELSLGAYATARHEVAFYFPAAGHFAHYPAQVSLDGRVLASGAAASLHVVTTPTVVDTTSWEHVSQNGTPEQVWAFLADANPRTLDLSRIAWRLKDRAFFDDAMAWASARRVASPELWSYGLLHEDAAASRAYLHARRDFVGRCGLSLESPLLSFDADALGSYEHVEFDPLVNQRAHAFGGRRDIMNPAVEAQWTALLRLLAYRPRLDDADRMALTYQLLLQDRVGDALAVFDQVARERVDAPMTYDAMRAYLALSRGDPAQARRLAEAWADHPVPRWAARFGEILAHVDEIEGGGADPGDDDGAGALDDEPWLELELVDGRLHLSHGNLATVELRYTPMDVELLFSTDPFLDGESQGASLLKSARRDTIEPGSGTFETVLDLPGEFDGRNVFIEARAGGLVSRQAHYAHSLSVALLSSRGELKLTRAGTRQPLSSAYVKVYARQPDGTVRFHKDGYTDLRGRFDYASVTAEGGLDVERFALLVMSADDGAVIKQVAPPAR